MSTEAPAGAAPDIGPVSFTADSRWVRRVPRPDARMRLVCLPFAGGGASVFQRLAALLPPWVELVTVQLPGREDRSKEDPPSSIAALVTACSIALRPYTTLPYALYGHCAGGLLAFEIAHEMGRRFGTWPQRLIVGEQPAPQAPPPAEPLHRLPDEQLVAAVSKRGGLPETVVRNTQLLEFLLPVLRSDFALWEKYEHRPRPPLPVPVTTVRGLTGSVAETALAGWAEQTDAGRTGITVEGGHYFITALTAAAAEQIGAQLDAAPAAVPAGRRTA
ncbi:thioesterase II family protein [Streptomyces violens]|uniref:thioesterase II family protein n=1 Tax=Streptomyces violens TaxID=66377 RepID=UPI0007C78C68|nr:thioesterase domain-containing protein [Streptomyces violens]